MLMLIICISAEALNFYMNLQCFWKMFFKACFENGPQNRLKIIGENNILFKLKRNKYCIFFIIIRKKVYFGCTEL